MTARQQLIELIRAAIERAPSVAHAHSLFQGGFGGRDDEVAVRAHAADLALDAILSDDARALMRELLDEAERVA